MIVEGVSAVDVQDIPPGTVQILRGGTLLIEKPTAPARTPWEEVKQASRYWPLWSAMVAETARATRRWEGSGPVGVRAWRLERDGRLCALAESDDWHQPMRARCEYGCGDALHAAPEPTSWCGLYAVRPEAAARLLAHSPLGHPKLGSCAVGVVSLYGRVIRHRYGWRAQYARIREVWWLAERDGPTPRTELYPGVTWHRVEAW